MSELQPAIDFLILADKAEAVNGKLYMMGGGWDLLTVANSEAPMVFSCALGILVPWLATNLDHRCMLHLQNADGGTLFEMTIGFRAGRPPHLEEGATQRLMIALPLSVQFQKPGVHVLVAQTGGDEKRARFEVRHAQPT